MSQETPADSDNPGQDQPHRTVPLARGLSTKLLFLTIAFVLLAEVLIFLPSIASYRMSWLQERLGTAAAVSIVLVQGDPASLSRAAQNDVLMAIGAKAIAVRDGGVSRLLVVADMPPQVDEHIDVANTSMAEEVMGALDTLAFGGERMLRVFGPVGDSHMEFELIMPDRDLRSAMLTYSRNVAFLSLLISLFTATLVYAAIDRIMIRPMRTMTRSMLAFSQAPEDPGRVIQPADRSDEIGVAERELFQMQERLQKMLAERKHLADLGLAVSKINHDMRNMLATAQLISDRLRMAKDPTVQAFAPKLLRALDRAVSYSEGVLAYGRTQEPPPSRRKLRLRQLVDEVHDVLDVDNDFEFVNAVEPGFEIDADSDQLFRVLTNLGRNAVQAMAADAESAIVRRLTISAERTGSVCRILVTDTGPGLPPKARENLFAAFRGSTRSGGTGLGLAIAQELVRAHGGTLELAESVGGNTSFAVTIPDQPVRLDQARSGLRRLG
ncbi:histidine kinase [Mesorhizobium sp. Root157]|uniref:sensor histidine kinase n=1 Tax=Mesorhizobium sp. Root157 TaxID=1736477 RepID=UPI000701B88D|nr:HAMP domain-containing sensor histidine kinase [Mesorhizobium sp. Root157]KQZ93815.1 histidine kinase [Mesorhizobium sp. Root157]